MAAYLITSQFLALLAPGFQNLSTVFIDSNYSRQVWVEAALGLFDIQVSESPT